MLCLTCGTKNVEGALFCGACGSSLTASRTEPRRRPCGRCGTENDPAARYCGNCGQELGVPGPLAARVNLRRFLIFSGILTLIVLLLLIGRPTIIIVLALLPAIVCVTIAVWIDRHEPEPWWLVSGAFLWGAAVALPFSGIVNDIGSNFVGGGLGAEAGDFYGRSISAPIIEETTKGAALAFVFYRRRHELNGVLDGVVYASMVGLGFAMTENLQYFQRALDGGVAALGANFVLRGVLLPFLHPLFTSMTGIGLVLALRAHGRRTKVTAPLVGLALAMLLHSLWNAAPYVFGPILILPVFVFVVILVRRSIRHEARVVRDYLPDGIAPREDVERLSSLRARVADAIRAFRKGGFRGWVAREEYIGGLSDLAFSRYRAVEAAAGAPQTASPEPEGFRELLASLRREWRRPTTRVS